MHVGDVIHAGEVKGATKEDILGQSSTVEKEGIGENIPEVEEPSEPVLPPVKAVTMPHKPSSKKRAPIRVSTPPVIGDYDLPTVDFLHEPDTEQKPTDSKEALMANARLMQTTLGQFGIEVSLGDITKGPNHHPLRITSGTGYQTAENYQSE